MTVVACYQPLQSPYGGPNYFTMDPDALYEIHFDRNGDALEDLTFQFRFTNAQKDIALTVGPVGQPEDERDPAQERGADLARANTANLNVRESYTVTMVTGDRRTGAAAAATHDGGQPRLHEAHRQHRQRSRSPTTRPTPPPGSTRSTSPARRRPGACSSASGRTRSP